MASAADIIALPSIAFLENPDLVKYCGTGETRLELGAALKAFDDFYVVNAETREHQRKMARLVDTISKGGVGVIHPMAVSKHETADHAEDRANAGLAVQRLLRLGASPDLMSNSPYQWNVSHFCATCGSVDAARALVVCRPNLSIRCVDELTPAIMARQMASIRGCRSANASAEVAKLFEEAEMNGFPSIAELAREQKWWAVHNLFRRGVVPVQEMFALDGGKDAVGWALHHGNVGMAQEIEFLFKVSGKFVTGFIPFPL